MPSHLRQSIACALVAMLWGARLAARRSRYRGSTRTGGGADIQPYFLAGRRRARAGVARARGRGVGGGLVVPQQTPPISQRSRSRELRLPGETLRESVPALAIALLQKRRLESEARRPDDVTALEHEGERVLELLRRERRIHRPFIRLGVGP